MAFGKRSEGNETISFECIYKECESACCKNTQVYLNTEDFQRLKSGGIDPFEASTEIELNDYLVSMNIPPFGQLDRLYVLKLKQDTDGNCIFLLPEGNCKIYEDRLFLCREFPFKIVRGKIKKTISCPGVGIGEEKIIEELIQTLDFDSSHVTPPYIYGDEKRTKMLNKLLAPMFRLLR